MENPFGFHAANAARARASRLALLALHDAAAPYAGTAAVADLPTAARRALPGLIRAGLADLDGRMFTLTDAGIARVCTYLDA